MRRRNALVAAGILSAALIGAGCATVESEALRVSLASVSIAEATLLEQRYSLRVRFQNPSERAVKLDGFVYDLTLNGRQFARGVSDQTIVVPRFGEQLIELPAIGTTGGAIRQVLDLTNRRQVDYRLVGRANEGGTQMRFDGKGDIPIPTQLFDLVR
ncbi:MAG: LEA type 2 family protein [Proteobacteria bacterium]|nr:LEA type 2 family protein [Burkholderiales bacterium]